MHEIKPICRVLRVNRRIMKEKRIPRLQTPETEHYLS